MSSACEAKASTLKIPDHRRMRIRVGGVVKALGLACVCVCVCVNSLLEQSKISGKNQLTRWIQLRLFQLQLHVCITVAFLTLDRLSTLLGEFDW